jgi:hypothetical protein
MSLCGKELGEGVIAVTGGGEEKHDLLEAEMHRN